MIKSKLVNSSLLKAQGFLDNDEQAKWTTVALSKAQPPLGNLPSASRLKAVSRLNGLISDSQRTRVFCEVDGTCTGRDCWLAGSRLTACGD
jgi:hypothetical protein